MRIDQSIKSLDLRINTYIVYKLGFNELEARSGKFISDMLKVNQTLEVLFLGIYIYIYYLDHNYLGDLGVTQIASGIKHNRTLISINLCKCAIIFIIIRE